MGHSDEELAQYYEIEKVQFESPGFKAHQQLVFNVYRDKGFLDIGSANELMDQHDNEHTDYYLLKNPDSSKEMAGTFRIIECNGGTLPVLYIYPRLHIEGIQTRLCESTRVVSIKRNLSGRSQLTRQILFEAVIRAVVHVKRRDLYAVISLGSPNIFEWINLTFSSVQRAIAAHSEYQGGIVVPSIIWLDEFEERVKKNKPYIYDYYLEVLNSNH